MRINFKIRLIIFCFSLLYSGVKAQDKIYKTDSTIIEAKVQEIGETAIKYKKFSNLTGPIYNINKEDVYKIVYENGETEIYNQRPQPPIGGEGQPKAVETAPAPAFDSLAYIEQYLGVKFETTTEDEGGVIIEGEYNTVLKPYSWGQGGSPDKKIITYAGTTNATSRAAIKNDLTRIRTTSDLCRVIFELKRTNVSKLVLGNEGTSVFNAFLCKADISDMGNNIPFNTVPSASLATARNFILAGNINEAIAAYAKLAVKDSTNAGLLAEYAYALALGGIYDAALINLDRVGYQTNNVKYYTSQVFALMGYDDIADEYWTPSVLVQKPAWITVKPAALLQKYKRKPAKREKPVREDIIAKFNLANQFVTTHHYFRSIALFHELTDMLPNEYLPYAGYSVPLEKTGAVDKSIQVIEKAISIVGVSPENAQKKQFLEQRLNAIKAKKASSPTVNQETPSVAKLKTETEWNALNRPQMMAYGGGIVAPSSLSLNGRLGYFITNQGNGALNFGFTSADGSTSYNIGLSVYNRWGILVYGVGIQLNSGSGETDWSALYTLGLSIKFKKQKNMSLDIYAVYNEDISNSSASSINLTFGIPFYFGTRK